MATHVSPDNTFKMVEQTPQRQNSDSGNPIITLEEAIAGIASQQQPQTSSPLFKPTTNTLIKKFEIFKDFFQTMLKMQPELSEAMKNYQYPSHFGKEALQTLNI